MNIEMNYQGDNGLYEVLYPKTLATNLEGHLWKRTYDIWTNTLGAIEEVNVIEAEGASDTYSVYYTSTFTVNQQTGKPQLGSIQSISVTYNNGLTSVANLKNRYWSRTPDFSGAIFFSPSDTTVGRGESHDVYYVHIQARRVNVLHDVSPAGVYTTESANTHTDNSWVNGYLWEYLGQAKDVLGTFCRMEIGSYTGTGTYGEESPTILNFKHIPKLVIIADEGHNNKYLFVGFYGMTGTNTRCDDNGNYGIANLTWSGPQLSIIGANTNYAPASAQMNSSGLRYYYVAFY